MQSRVQLCYLFMRCDLLSASLSLQTKQFADKDNADLFAEEAAQQREVRLCQQHHPAADVTHLFLILQHTWMVVSAMLHACRSVRRPTLLKPGEHCHVCRRSGNDWQPSLA